MKFMPIYYFILSLYCYRYIHSQKPSRGLKCHYSVKMSSHSTNAVLILFIDPARKIFF